MTDNDFLLSDLHGREGSFLPCQKNAGNSEANLDVTKWIKFCNMDRHATTPHLHAECLAKGCYVTVIHNLFPET
jgi:hypothetical protein